MTEVGFADDSNSPVIGLVTTALGDLCESLAIFAQHHRLEAAIEARLTPTQAALVRW